MVVPGKFNPLSFWRVARDHGVTWYSAVPTIHQLLLARVEPAAGRPAGAEQLRFIRSCSASLPPQVMHDLEAAFGAPVLEAYGMTEAAHQMASNPLPPAARKPGSVGRGTDVQISIMDADGQAPAGRRARRGRDQGAERHRAATRTIPRRTPRRSPTAGSAPAIRAFSTSDGYLTLVAPPQGADQPRRREDLAARDRRGAAGASRRWPKRCASACRTRRGARRSRRRSSSDGAGQRSRAASPSARSGWPTSSGRSRSTSPRRFRAPRPARSSAASWRRRSRRRGDESVRIVIAGAGAIGGYIGARLRAACRAPTSCCSRAARTCGRCRSAACA